MFLFLSKFLPLLVYPVGVAVLLLLASLIFYRHVHVQRLCVVGALIVLLFFGNKVVAHGLARSLEWRHLPSGDTPAGEAIVLLGGGTRPQLPPRPIAEINEAGDRLIYAAELYHAQKAPFIVASGGLIEFFGSTVPETEAMLELLVALGVPREDVRLEERARNTYENAVYVREMLAPQGIDEIVLVTSAMHMPRSVALFEKQGFTVAPAPVDFYMTGAAGDRTADPGWAGRLIELLPNVEYLEVSTRALREYLGMFVYGLRGWI